MHTECGTISFRRMTILASRKLNSELRRAKGKGKGKA